MDQTERRLQCFLHPILECFLKSSLEHTSCTCTNARPNRAPSALRGHCVMRHDSSSPRDSAEPMNQLRNCQSEPESPRSQRCISDYVRDSVIQTDVRETSKQHEQRPLSNFDAFSITASYRFVVVKSTVSLLQPHCAADC